MKIVAMLSFFEEEPDLLRRCVSKVVSCGVDHVLAVDGRYEHYPSDQVSSPPACGEAIAETAWEGGATFRIFSSDSPFEGNEVGKRQFMMEKALAATDERDWLLIVDSDHFWESEGDLHDLIGESSSDSFARVAFAEVWLEGVPWWQPMRPLMRARCDLRMGTNHYTYVTDEGISRILERPDLGPMMPATDLMDSIRVTHGVHDRDEDRRDRQAAFYEQRHRLKLES